MTEAVRQRDERKNVVPVCIHPAFRGRDGWKIFQPRPSAAVNSALIEPTRSYGETKKRADEAAVPKETIQLHLTHEKTSLTNSGSADLPQPDWRLRRDVKRGTVGGGYGRASDGENSGSGTQEGRFRNVIHLSRVPEWHNDVESDDI